MKLFANRDSANCYKVDLTLQRLELPYERVEVELVPLAERPAELLARHPGGRVPFLAVDENFGLSESGAILNFLAQGTELLPDDARGRAEVLRWMFFEQNHLEPNIATKRYWVHLSGRPEERAEVFPLWQANGEWTLEQMERHLSAHDYFATGRFTIADIALFGYTHVAPEGGFPLDPYPALRAWIERVQAEPRYVAMGSVGG